jgi:hypothetical protein
MNIDGNTAALNAHQKEIDAAELRQERIDIRAEQIAGKLREQKMVRINGDTHLYHIDEFIADDVFNTGPVCALLAGNADSLMEELTEKFDAWCSELAEKDIDNMEPDYE